MDGARGEQIVRVLDGNGQGIENAEVSVSRDSARPTDFRTDKDGRCLIDLSKGGYPTWIGISLGETLVQIRRSRVRFPLEVTIANANEAAVKTEKQSREKLDHLILEVRGGKTKTPATKSEQQIRVNDFNSVGFEDARIHVWSNKGKELSAGRTDKAGLATLALPNDQIRSVFVWVVPDYRISLAGDLVRWPLTFTVANR